MVFHINYDILMYKYKQTYENIKSMIKLTHSYFAYLKWLLLSRRLTREESHILFLSSSKLCL